MPGRRAHAVAFLLVLIFLGELVFSVHRQSLSWDEGDHIYAGYESWAAGESRLIRNTAARAPWMRILRR